MRKQGDNAASIPKRATISPGSRLGASIGKAIPRLAPGGFYDARLRIASAAAATVASMSASVCAAEKKSASYWLHGR